MEEERDQSGTAEERDDSFEALLKGAAHASGPTVSSLGIALRPGTTTLLNGRLRVERSIGHGGMGVVYEVHDAQRRSSVALKTLTRLDAGSVYRLKNEFRSLAEVSHPNLCRLHELFSEGGQWFFTMELVDGERFDRWVRPGGVLDEARLRAALPQLCDGIGAIHAAGKLHRDLKPSNVLVAHDGRVVVLDFGLAVEPELGGVGQTVLDDSVSGTPAYMAPEQAAGRTASAASDFYALGVMLFEALTGRLPFEGRAHEMLTDKQRIAAPSARASVPDAPLDLDALCTMLLARDAGMRPDLNAVRAQLGLVTTPHADSTWRTRTTTAPHAPDATPAESAPDLLGRESELQALHDAFAATAAATASTPVVLFVSGESGMGKSALVATFLDTLRASHRATVLAGRCYERENVPFKGFDSVVDELSRHLRKLPGQEAAALLPREVYALARIFPVLDRVPVIAEAPKKHVPDPQDLKRRAFDAFGELLARLRDRAPLCVFIDDVQWLDQDSVRLMRALFVAAEPPPVLLICAHRSEGVGDNALLQSVLQAAHDSSALRVSTLAVGPLPANALAVLARRMLPNTADSAAATAFAAETGGSPFFANELARAAALRAPGAALPSLADAIGLHVAALPEGAQQLLAVLALAGQPLSPSLAIEASGLSEGHAALDRLRSEQLVRVSLDEDGERSVECYHDKIREQVAGALDAPRTQQLALALSRALLTEHDSDAELIAHCLELTGRPEEAAVHTARAADIAFAALAFERAAKLFTRALDHGRFGAERAQTLRVAKADALAHAGQGERAAEAFIDAAHHANAEQADELTHRAGEQYLLTGDLERGRALLARALRRVGHSLPQNLAATLASVAWSRTRLRVRGLSFVPRTEHGPATLRELDALRMATHCLVRSDQLRAADFCARWLVCALDAGHTIEVARALATELMFISSTGAPEERVVELIAMCEPLCKQTGDGFAAYSLRYYCGIHKLVRLGQVPEAIKDLEDALLVSAVHPFSTSSYDRAWQQYMRSAAIFAAGRLRDAGELAQSQLENARARGDYTVVPGLSQIVFFGLLAADRPEHAARIMSEECARLRPGEVTLQDFLLTGVAGLAQMYQGDARQAWSAFAPLVERFSKSFHGRVMMRGATEVMTCGVAAAAARQATEPAQRRELARVAERLAKRARTAPNAPASPGCPDAVIACLHGDRAGAIAAIRKRLSLPLAPLGQQLLRHRLGELLADDEGRALAAEADAFLRAGGIVNPKRFIAAFTAGIELG